MKILYSKKYGVDLPRFTHKNTAILHASTKEDDTVRYHSLHDNKYLQYFKGHRGRVISLEMSPVDDGFMSGSLDKTLKYWDVRPILGGKSESGPGRERSGSINGKVAERDGGDKGSQCTMNFVGHKDYVLSVAVSHDGEWVVSGSKDRGVQFWDAKTAVVQCMLQGHKNSGACVLEPL